MGAGFDGAGFERAEFEGAGLEGAGFDGAGFEDLGLAEPALPDERRALIVAEILLRGGATVQGLARVCGVSVGTIRRDLLALDQDGLVHKVHGGAVAPEVVAALARSPV